MYFAGSVFDRVVVACFLELHVMVPDPSANTFLEVFFLSSNELIR